MTYDPDHHHRRSIRLPGYDYTQAGWYFVTLVTQGRECLFADATWRLVAETLWQQIPRHCPQVSLDAWIVMPNHLHGILVLAGAPENGGRAQADHGWHHGCTDSWRYEWPIRAPARAPSGGAEEQPMSDHTCPAPGQVQERGRPRILLAAANAIRASVAPSVVGPCVAPILLYAPGCKSLFVTPSVEESPCRRAHGVGPAEMRSKNYDSWSTNARISA